MFCLDFNPTQFDFFQWNLNSGFSVVASKMVAQDLFFQQKTDNTLLLARGFFFLLKPLKS